jgi:DNA mismatch endonuclease (patch repair protein)
MPDKFSKEIRRKTMQAVRSRNTKLENAVMRILFHRGIRYRRNVRDLPGKPDIAIKRSKIVIFIDSCFWHGCKTHFRLPETNREYWRLKIERNRARDLKTTEYYLANGWHLKRIWEHELKKDFEKTMEKVTTFINQHNN